MASDKPLPISHRKRYGSETRKRGTVFTFRVLPEERKRIEARAEVKGLTLGSYIRSVLIEDSKTRSQRKPRADVVALARVLGQFGKVGGNIHQILKAVNFQEPYEKQRAIEAYQAVIEMKHAVMGAISPREKHASPER